MPDLRAREHGARLPELAAAHRAGGADGPAMRLVHASGRRATSEPDAGLVRLLALARHWWAELRKGGPDVTTLAAREKRTPSYVTRVVRLAFLSPAVTTAIVNGQQRASATARPLTQGAPFPAPWTERDCTLLPEEGD